MFLLSRRQVHAALAGAGATLAYLAAAEVGSKKPVRVGGLVVLSSMALAGLMSSQSSVKARNTENRLNGFFNNGGSVGGNFVVNGNHTVTGTQAVTGVASFSSDTHIAGSMFGTGGTLTSGDALHINGNPLTADGTITSHADINATTGTITGGTVNSNGDVHATSGTVHAANVASTGPVSASSTITAGGTISNTSGNINTNGNVNASGAISGGSTTNNFGGGGPLGSAAAGWETACQARVNDLLTALG